MSYPERRLSGAPNPWLFSPRPIRGAQLIGAQIHATRSGVSDGDDGPRTENWMRSPGNGSAAQGWGGSCDLIIFEDGTRVIVNPDIEAYDCTYGAGFGGSPFTWSCGWYYEQIEMAQGAYGDPYTFEAIDSLAEYLIKRGYPPVRIPFLTQTLGLTPPAGICTHEDSENGVKLGKSDPGAMFPWPLLFERMAAHSGQPQAEEDDDMTPEQATVLIAKIERMEKDLADIHQWLFDAGWNPPNESGESNHAAQIAKRLDQETAPGGGLKLPVTVTIQEA